MAIGRAAKTKVNANMGASPGGEQHDEEVDKLRWAERWGADTVMDLSTGGDLDACRDAIIKASTGADRNCADLLDDHRPQARGPGLRRILRCSAPGPAGRRLLHRARRRRPRAPAARARPAHRDVSRGGSLLAKWMLHHGEENPMYTLFEDICAIMRRYDVSFSLGDGLRPWRPRDATDGAQLAELRTLGELTERAWRKGVQVMVEGPGHVPFESDRVQHEAAAPLCHGAPFYVLGPARDRHLPRLRPHHQLHRRDRGGLSRRRDALLRDPEGARRAAEEGRRQSRAASPTRSRPHAADVALGIPGARDRDDELTKARAALNWERHFELAFDGEYAPRSRRGPDVGHRLLRDVGHDWCSVRIRKEIVEWSSARTVPRSAPRCCVAGAHRRAARMLEKRGVLPAEELHRLASKTRQAVGARDRWRRATRTSPTTRPPSAVQAATLIGAALVATATSALGGLLRCGSSARDPPAGSREPASRSSAGRSSRAGC